MYVNKMIRKVGKSGNKQNQRSPQVTQRAVDSRGRLTEAGMLGLQRTAGNQAVLQALKAGNSIQRLEIPEEEENMQMKADAPVQRQEDPDEEELQMKADAPVQRQEDPDEEELQMKADTGNRTGMPDKVKTKMERAFNADFSDVRIYEGDQATSVGALAYTQGTDIHFAPGKYRPETEEGQKLLGHELTHVIQQKEGRVKPTTKVNGVSVNDDPGLEQEADRMGEMAAKFSLPASNHGTMQQKKDASPTVSSSAQPIQGLFGLFKDKKPKKPEYEQIYEYLQQKALEQDKVNLFEFFDELPERKKRRVIHRILEGAPVTLENFKDKIKSIFHRIKNLKWKESVNWEKFSNVVRVVKEEKDEEGMGVQEALNYAGMGVSAGLTGVGKSFKMFGKNSMSEETTKRMESLFAGGMATQVGVMTGLVDASVKGYELAKDWGSLNKAEAGQHLAEFATSLGETAKTTSESVKGFAEGLGKEALKQSAETVAGGLAIGIGAVDVLRGGIGTVVHHKRAKELENIAKDETKPEELRQVAFAAQKAQEMQRDMSAFRAARGAALVAGGALVVASLGAAPVVLMLAAVLGGIAAIYKYFQNKSKKKEIVDKMLGIDYIQDEALREKSRNQRIQRLGFYSIDQYYDDLMDKYAQYLYEEGVEKDNEDVKKVLKKMGFSMKRNKPTKEKIKKKLAT